MVAGKRDGCRPEPFGHRHRGTIGQLTHRLCTGGHHDPGRCPAESLEVVLVVGARYEVLSDQRVVPGTVILHRKAESSRIRSGLVSEISWDQASVTNERDEFGHRRTEAVTSIGQVNVQRRGKYLFAVWEHLGGRRLMSDEYPDILRMPRYQRKSVDGAAAAGEHVHRPGVQRRYHPAQVIRVLTGGRFGGAVSPFTAIHPAGIVGHYRPVSEVSGKGAESARTHRRSGKQEDRFAAGLAAADVITQHGARNIKSVRGRFDHDGSPKLGVRRVSNHELQYDHRNPTAGLISLPRDGSAVSGHDVQPGTVRRRYDSLLSMAQQQSSMGHGSTARNVARLIGQVLWTLLPIISLTFLAWLPATQAWWRARTSGWLITALLLILSSVGIIAADANSAGGAVWGILVPASLIGGMVAALLARPVVFGRRGSVERAPVADRRVLVADSEVATDPAVQAVLHNRERRRQARAIAASDPAMALELGIGRPDIAGTYDDGGLVDLNNTTVDGLVAALGWDRPVAEDYVVGRDVRRGYESLDEVGALSGIDPESLEQDAERLIVLPYRSR